MLSRLLAAILLSSSALLAQPVTAPKTLADADKLESQLESKPGDLNTRAMLLRFYFQATTLSPENAKALRRKHILYLIEHNPDASVLAESSATLDKTGHPLADPAAYAAADTLWRKQLSATQPSPNIYTNAFNFYKTADPPFARTLLQQALEAYPANTRLASDKGTLLAYTILGVKLVDRYGQAMSFDDAGTKSEEAVLAPKQLETSTSANVIGSAATAIVQQQSSLRVRNRIEEMNESTALAEHLFQRALELEPKNPRWNSGLATLYWNTATRLNGAEKIALLEKALRTAGDAQPNTYILPELAQAYFATGNMERAAEAATACLSVASRQSDPNHGGAIHFGNIVLGRIALRQGDIEEAKHRLLAAGDTTSTPVLMSFGPNWDLAQDLLARGERDTVLAYIEECRSFWQLDRGNLTTWAAAIRNGGAPDFFGRGPSPTPQLLGKMAPDFRLKRLAGGETTLAEWKGKVVLLDFWATWCAPCRQEMPDFEKLHRELAPKDVVILAIDASEAEDIVAEYIAKEKFTFPVLLGDRSMVVDHYRVTAFPTLMAVDKTGRIADIAVGTGRDSESRIRQAIDRALAGAPSPLTAGNYK